VEELHVPLIHFLYFFQVQVLLVSTSYIFVIVSITKRLSYFLTSLHTDQSCFVAMECRDHCYSQGFFLERKVLELMFNNSAEGVSIVLTIIKILILKYSLLVENKRYIIHPW
jgi:hypothetical protein